MRQQERHANPSIVLAMIRPYAMERMPEPRNARLLPVEMAIVIQWRMNNVRTIPIALPQRHAWIANASDVSGGNDDGLRMPWARAIRAGSASYPACLQSRANDEHDGLAG